MGYCVPGRYSFQDIELRLAHIAITIAKLAGCPVVLSPVRNVAVMHRIYAAQRDEEPIYIYADFAAEAFNAQVGRMPHNILVADLQAFCHCSIPFSDAYEWPCSIYRS